MGNVQASESGVPPPGMSPSAPSLEERNPGTVEDLHKECKEIFPMAFEGAKLVVQKALSNNFQVLLISLKFVICELIILIQDISFSYNVQHDAKRIQIWCHICWSNTVGTSGSLSRSDRRH